MIREFAAGSMTHQDVFNDHGHGAIIYSQEPHSFGEGDYDLVVTGPRRNMIRGGGLTAYFPAPYGDMMLTGCFGLLAAAVEKLPELGDEIRNGLFPEVESDSGKPPWELF
jgi:hypothetical protein